MSLILDELSDQPNAWRQAAELASTASAALPQPGERVAVIGCGTSLYMGQSYAALREAAGHGETDAFAASEAPAGRHYDRVVALTRSGTTSEVLSALEHLPHGTRTVGLTARPEAPIAAAVDELVTLDFAAERSVVQTRFATSALLLLRAHLGEDAAPIAADGQLALDSPLPDGVVERSHFAFLGRGWTVGLANEAALKLREAAGAWTESYPAMEYRHGPISASGPQSAVWFFGPAPDGLVDDVRRTGALPVTSSLDPLADLVRAQRLAVALAEARGMNPDEPRHLTYSVVLDG